MTQPLSPREVFLELLHGVCDRRFDDLPRLYAGHTHVVHPFDPLRAPALVTRQQIKEHFAGANDALGDVRFQPANVTIHETADPEVIVAEFEYRGTVPGTGEPFAIPGIFVQRIRNGQIVESRDYADHVAMMRVLNRLDAVVTALKTRPIPA
jgi:ketosteroid isomerase-like protein